MGQKIILELKLGQSNAENACFYNAFIEMYMTNKTEFPTWVSPCELNQQILFTMLCKS